nr:MAG TPA: hypothetical protein [Caudoviricetes sp.]
MFAFILLLRLVISYYHASFSNYCTSDPER